MCGTMADTAGDATPLSTQHSALGTSRTQVYHALDVLPPTPSVVTIGTFDGVHRGHQRLIEIVVERARARGVRSVVITFDPHPRAVLAPESAPARLTRVEEEVRLIAALGVDAMVIHPFTRETANTAARDFIAAVVRTARPVELW